MRPAILGIAFVLLGGCFRLPPAVEEDLQKTALDAFARPYRIEAYQRQGKSPKEAERLADRDEKRGKWEADERGFRNVFHPPRP